MRLNFHSLHFIAFAAVVVFAPMAASAATCGGDYGAWLQGVKQEAASRGIGAGGLAALNGVTPDPAVISHDRGQGVFRQTFEQFAPHRVNPLLNLGANKLRALGSFFSRLESQTGVPGDVLVAIWGLETSFGAVNGDFLTIRSLVTLAHDCRRSDRFRSELFDALKIVESGYMSAASMRGAWAGEIGQTQFMPSSYLKFAAGSDLIHSSEGALTATANYLRGYGWSKGAGWEPGQPNFVVIKQWNKSDVYARTIAYFATRLGQMVH
jgi:lytic murein transglycosylase